MKTGRMPPNHPLLSWPVALLAVGLIAIAALNIYAAPRYPAPSCDEVSISSIATSFLEQGRFGWSVFTQGDIASRDINVFRHGRLYTAGLIALFWAFGVSLTTARAYSLIGGLVATALVFYIGRRFYNGGVGLLAAMVFATSVLTFLSAHLLRPDIWLSAFNLLTLLSIHKALNISRARWSFLSGLLAVACFDIHGHGFAIVTAALVIIVYDAGWRQKQWAKPVALIGGLAVGFAVWLVIHLWPSPQAAYSQVGEVLAFTNLAPAGSQSTSGPLQNILSVGPYLVSAYWGTGVWLGVLEAVLSLVGVVVALHRRNASDQLLLIWSVITFLVYATVFSQRFVNYNILWSPLLILLGVAAVEELFKRAAERLERPRLAQPATALAIGILAALNVGGDMSLARIFNNTNFDSMGQTLQAVVPGGSRVLADPNWWWWLRTGRTFITDEYFLYPMPPFTSPPTYVLIDSATSCINRDGPGHSELVDYVVSNCTLVTRLDGAWVNDPSRSTTLLGQTTSVYRCTQP
jgi:4-amino-4-deoxy-L-arabinose transferase-like glycosyltransferase